MTEQKHADSDYIVRAVAASDEIRAFAMRSTGIVEEAKQRHQTHPTVTAALGRLLTGGAMMGVMMKGEKDLLTLQIKSAGPIGGMTVTADSRGNVKGYANVPDVDVPPSPQGKLDVGYAVGPGELQVVKDLGLKDPYVSTVLLQSGEIGDDLTYYFAASEQTPSAVGLGVLMNTDNTVKTAGGFIIQLMPSAREETVAELEKRISRVTSVTELLDRLGTPEAMLKEILGDMGLQITDTVPAAFTCSCSRARVEKVLYSLPKEEILDMIRDGESIEIKCHFCNTAYEFTAEELQRVLEQRFQQTE
jgi:molecular chaperone Hsp33